MKRNKSFPREWRAVDNAQSAAVNEIVGVSSDFDSLWVSEEVVEDVSSVDEAAPVGEWSSEAHCSLTGAQKLNWVSFAALDEEVIVSELNVEAWELGIVDPYLNFGEGELSSKSSPSQSGAKEWLIWLRIEEENVIIPFGEPSES